MTSEEIKLRLINNDALFNNIFVIEQDFDIVPNTHPHYGASITYQDLTELRRDFLLQLVDTVMVPQSSLNYKNYMLLLVNHLQQLRPR